MAVEAVTMWRASDGKMYATLEEAERTELRHEVESKFDKVMGYDVDISEVIGVLLTNSELIIRFLQTGQRP